MHYIPEVPQDLTEQLRSIKEQLKDIEFRFEGTKAKASSEEVPPEAVSINHRMDAILAATWSSTGIPTQTMRSNYEIVRAALPEILGQLRIIEGEIKLVEARLEALKAPYTPGRLPELR